MMSQVLHRWISCKVLGLPADEKWTSIFNNTKQQLDHILLSRFRYERMTASGITRVQDTVSDHDPVWATLDLSLPAPQ